MNVIQMAKDKYHERIEQQKQLLEMLNSDDIQKLEKMGIITINTDNIPNEEEILYDSFHFTASDQTDWNEGIYVYVCDLQDKGETKIGRRYTNSTIRNEGVPLSSEGFCKFSIYVGLLTERRKLIYPRYYDLFKKSNTIIHLPYPYTITETHVTYPDCFYPADSWPFRGEHLKIDGFQEQFMALQEHFSRNLLEHSWEESVNEIEKRAVLQKVCARK